jgi:hypothetical protein
MKVLGGTRLIAVSKYLPGIYIPANGKKVKYITMDNPQPSFFIRRRFND